MRVFLFATLILILSQAISSGYDFGTKVMANDTDIGKPLFDLPGGWTIGFWDTTGTHGYDQADPVYLHQARCRNSMIAANDVRLNSIGNHCPGSKVTFEDIDMNKPLTPLPATINYLNLYGSSAYDLDDPVYLHQYYCGANNIDLCKNKMLMSLVINAMMKKLTLLELKILRCGFRMAVGFPCLE